MISFDLKNILDTLSSFMPRLIRSPLKLFNFGLKFFNQITEVTLFVILIGQTVHILQNSEKRFINLRHLLLKWIIFIVIVLLVDQVKRHTIFDQIFILLCNGIAVTMVYPSKFIKNLHLKYFTQNEKKRSDESLDDPRQLDITLTTRILISLSITFLNFSRLLITFVPLNQRRQIEDAVKEVNLTIVEEKYFGKIYDTKQNKDQETLNRVVTKQVSTQNLTKSHLSSKADKKSEKAKNSKCIKMKVDENIEINLGSIISSQQGQRNFAFYREIQIIYDGQIAELTIKDLENQRISTQTLAEVLIIDDLMVQLIFEDDVESIFVKFKSKKEKELFINYIYLRS